MKEGKSLSSLNVRAAFSIIGDPNKPLVPNLIACSLPESSNWSIETQIPVTNEHELMY